VVGVGADLEPGTLLQAYRTGLFPMPVGEGRRQVLAWWSPDPRAVLPLGGLKVSRSLRKACDRFEVRFDSAFDAVLEACADPERPGRWITPDVAAAYGRLHDLGWAHSVEAWAPDGRLVGGLYGVAIGGLFAGESMFHRKTDGSKAAVAGLVELLSDKYATERVLDIQWVTSHLATLGAISIPRDDYVRRVDRALAYPLPAAFS
jgi:leucyl/phenylalanyl-tRNA--protein transferase